jgi:hypothetical protein
MRWGFARRKFLNAESKLDDKDRFAPAALIADKMSALPASACLLPSAFCLLPFAFSAKLAAA